MTPTPDLPALPGLLRRLWAVVGPRRRRQFVLLFGLANASALAEVVSLGAILPFLAILTAPDLAMKKPAVRAFAGLLGISTARELVLPLTAAFVVAVLASSGVRMLLLWANARLTSATGADLGLEAYRRTLYQPYTVHLAQNSSEVISGITNKVNTVVYAVIQPLLTLIGSLVFIVAIMGTLLIIDPVVATSAAFGFSLAYALITWRVRRRLASEGFRASEELVLVIKALQEGLGGIRDVLLDGTQPTYCAIYARSDRLLRRAWGNQSLISQSPRYLMEALGMVLIAGLAYSLSLRPGGVGAALPLLGALALGAQRMLPALQQAYTAWVSITGGQASLADTLDLLERPLPPEASAPPPDPLPLREAIRFDGVRFRYAEGGPWVLDGLDITIPKGSRVGFVGVTGSGKSTALDLLMGLLEPTEGRILVDGEPVEGPRIRAWQRSLAHVPQAIFLADTTLAENIAFGVPPDQIDLERVRRAARQAHIADFIESRPEGYQARIGERGIRLSGGQRQRIGIARALYKQATVLVFDEATSALDNATEQSVMEAIEGLDRELTVLIIAHRLSTVKRCDAIVELQAGRAAAVGTFEELLASSPGFQHLAGFSAP
ncbi:MAG: ABC transporter ATP-binding protein [Holophagaceae bacterium]